MPNTLGRSLWIFGLLVIAVLSWHWLDNSATVLVKDDDPVAISRHQSDYYLEDFFILNVDNEHGQVYEITGDTLVHHVTEGNSTIDQPSVQVFNQSKDFWRGNATTGDLSADFNILTLSGSVALSQHRHEGSAPIKIDTESVTIDTDKLTMVATTPVKISSDSWTFEAEKMQADVESGTLSFDTGVEAQYDVE